MSTWTTIARERQGVIRKVPDALMTMDEAYARSDVELRFLPVRGGSDVQVLVWSAA
ncbi:hypothetical protein [Rhizosaccharibacter radicis]|uniref:Uncharacterized protein n=1 Tax=Rhizosaccharibacter radicis TaxID=2782605 RepID=A0ABT1VX98_9PROT|nr:hypothetical protein [Acetobacteraceae bacterium KSS12]